MNISLMLKVYLSGNLSALLEISALWLFLPLITTESFFIIMLPKLYGHQNKLISSIFVVLATLELRSVTRSLNGAFVR